MRLQLGMHLRTYRLEKYVPENSGESELPSHERRQVHKIETAKLIYFLAKCSHHLQHRYLNTNDCGSLFSVGDILKQVSIQTISDVNKIRSWIVKVAAEYIHIPAFSTSSIIGKASETPEQNSPVPFPLGV